MLAQLKFRPLWLTLGWILVVFIVYESLTPSPVEIPIEQGDKLGHMAAYLALMSWFANIYEDTGERLACALGCISLGVGLEFAQRLTATRTFDVADMLAGVVGVLAAWLLAPPRLPNYLHLAERIIGARSATGDK
jgi:VanZ family protein